MQSCLRGLVAVALFAVLNSSASAQYGGWGGWGGNTVASANARGMGVLAAGAGQYNEQTAVARSINANTAMQMNEYIYQSTMQNAANDYANRLAAAARTQKAQNEIYARLHDNPEPHDVHTGDALNVVLDELTNPKVYTQVVQKATTQIPTDLVKNIQFMYAAKMIAISIADLSERGVPDDLATNPAFETQRKAVKELVVKAKQEGQSYNQVSIGTLRSLRVAVDALKTEVDSVYAQGTPMRIEADNFLKAMMGMTKLLEDPMADQFLKELNRFQTTTLAHLITFMHSFNLRFNAAKSPIQETAYDQLYPMLVALRDQAQAKGPSQLPPPTPTDPRVMNSYFSNVEFSGLAPKPNAAGAAAPPAANPPK